MIGIWGLGFVVFGFRDRVAGFGVRGFQGSRFGVSGSVFRDFGLGCGVRGFRGSGLRVSCAGFGVRGSGFSRFDVVGFSRFWVSGFGCGVFDVRSLGLGRRGF